MFKRSAQNIVTLDLTKEEKEILLDLYLQMQSLLAVPEMPENLDPLAALVGLAGPTEAPGDPAVARLFPSAYVDDEDAAADFRRYTEPDLRTEKIANLKKVVQSLDGEFEKLELTAEQTNAWLRSLNDLRLVLGTRLGITNEREDELDDDPGFHLYDYLTYLQGTLIDAL